jgi:primary-amine oxidase
MCGIKDITNDLVGFVYCDDEYNMTYTYTVPLSRNGSRAILWVVFQQENNNYWTEDVSASTILPVGIILGLDVSGTDPSLHKLLLLVYQTQYFSTVDDFRNAYNDGSLVRAPKNNDTSWTSPKRNDSAPERPLASNPSPQSVVKEKRYTVRDDNLVEWMDWSFFITYSRDLGITLYDIKFKGERIIYELGLKEALTHYAGNDPYTASTAYLDSYIGMGVFQFQLVEGYDVPFNSTLLDIIFHTVGNTVTQKKAIAVFEIDNTMPLQHHAATSIEELEYDWTWISSIKSPLLVVRAISSLGNYDYLFDYIFYLDGTIEVKTAASGYLQAMYYTSMENTFGSHVHNTLDCGIHTHFFSYKVDLDVCGKNNSFQRVNMVPVEVEYPFFKDIEPGKFGSFQLQRDWVAN